MLLISGFQKNTKYKQWKWIAFCPFPFAEKLFVKNSQAEHHALYVTAF